MNVKSHKYEGDLWSLVYMKRFLIGDELLPSASEGHSRAGLFGDINKKQRWVYYRTLREGGYTDEIRFCDTRRTADVLCSDARLKTLHMYWNLAGWIILLSWSVALSLVLSFGFATMLNIKSCRGRYYPLLLPSYQYEGLRPYQLFTAQIVHFKLCGEDLLW